MATGSIPSENNPRYFAYKGGDIAGIINRMPDAEFHQMPFGAILLDADAKIIRYNAMEGAITNRDYKQQTGKDFFRDLATCGMGPFFAGRFRECVLVDSYDKTFPYILHNAMPETPVIVRMVSAMVSPAKRGAWVFIKRISIPQPA